MLLSPGCSALDDRGLTVRFELLVSPVTTSVIRSLAILQQASCCSTRCSESYRGRIVDVRAPPKASARSTYSRRPATPGRGLTLSTSVGCGGVSLRRGASEMCASRISSRAMAHPFLLLSVRYSVRRCQRGARLNSDCRFRCLNPLAAAADSRPARCQCCADIIIVTPAETRPAPR